MRFNNIHQSRVDAADSAYVLTDEELGMSESTVKRRRASAARKLKNCG